MKRAITPGTFDPLTSGHLDIITRAAQLFDEVIVAVAASEKKHPLFSLDERVALAREATTHLPNVRVEPFAGLLVDFAHEQGTSILVKGLRATTDFEYEFAMTAANYHLDPDLETVFIMSSPKNMYVSSSLVREIASFQGNISDFVPPCVLAALERKFADEGTADGQAEEPAEEPAGDSAAREDDAGQREGADAVRLSADTAAHAYAGHHVRPWKASHAAAAKALDRAAMGEYYARAEFEYGFSSMCKMELPDDLEGKTVLDLCCRRGKGAYKLSDCVGADGRVIGVDWSPACIEEAKAGVADALKRSDAEGGEPRIDFIVAYPEDLDAAGIEDASVDCVWVNSVLNLCFAPETVLSECARVLKPGGQLFCQTVVAGADRDERVVEEARVLGNAIQAAPSKDDFEAMLEDAGFNAPVYAQAEVVQPDLGYKVGHEAPVAPSDEEVTFASVVVTASR